MSVFPPNSGQKEMKWKKNEGRGKLITLQIVRDQSLINKQMFPSIHIQKFLGSKVCITLSSLSEQILAF